MTNIATTGGLVPVARPAGVSTPATAPYWQAAAEGRLLLQRCVTCGSLQHYPRTLCAACWSGALAWQEATGLGTVAAFTVVHQPGHPAWRFAVPYVLALVELDEGPLMTTNVIGVAPEEVWVGQRVRLGTDLDQTGLAGLPPSGPATLLFTPINPTTSHATDDNSQHATGFQPGLQHIEDR